MKLIHAISIVACLTLSLGAAAQDYMGMFNASSTAGINIAGTIATNAAIKKQAEKAARAESYRSAGKHIPTKKPLAMASKLAFKPDPVVSRWVKNEFHLAVQRADPRQADHIAAVLAAQNVLADFDRDMAPYGFRSNNLADATTAYWITMWMVANQASVPSKEKVAAARLQVTENILAIDAVADATLEQQQELTEGLVYETMFALGQRANAELAGNSRRQRELADNVQRNVLKMGVNLQTVQLTRSGFIGR